MTNEELYAYYADLLIVQYRGKSKAYATIQELARLVVMNQLPNQVQNAFDINTAVGVQLNILAKYVGVSRSGYGIGGVPITLSDLDFRSLIKVAVIENNSGSSLYDIQILLANFFPGQLYAFETGVMQMSYFMLASAGSQDLAQIFVNEDILPKPMGVQLASLIYLPFTNSLFGFRNYQAAGVGISPMNSYTNYQLTYPWLSYANAISI